MPIQDTRVRIIADDVVGKVNDLLADKVYKIILYGSRARGDFSEESDLDIMVLIDCPKDEVREYRKEVSRLSSRASLEADMEVSLILRDRASYEEGLKFLPFYRNVEKEGIILYG